MKKRASRLTTGFIVTHIRDCEVGILRKNLILLPMATGLPRALSGRPFPDKSLEVTVTSKGKQSRKLKSKYFICQLI